MRTVQWRLAARNSCELLMRVTLSFRGLQSFELLRNHFCQSEATAGALNVIEMRVALGRTGVWVQVDGGDPAVARRARVAQRHPLSQARPPVQRILRTRTQLSGLQSISRKPAAHTGSLDLRR